MKLTDNERERIALLLDLLRDANRRAGEAGREWREKSAELNDLGDRQGWTEEQRRTVRSANWGLNDAYASWGFARDEVLRLAAALNGELAARQLLAEPPARCPFTHAHSRHWCGYSTCRES